MNLLLWLVKDHLLYTSVKPQSLASLSVGFYFFVYDRFFPSGSHLDVFSKLRNISNKITTQQFNSSRQGLCKKSHMNFLLSCFTLIFFKKLLVTFIFPEIVVE